MQLSIHHTQKRQHKLQAAFIKGTTVGSWLLELSRWEIELDRLSCFLLPSSIDKLSPAGLFVVFRFPEDAAKLELLTPYGRIGKKLYLPIDAQLFPQSTPEELNQLLPWEIQIFHPSIGLVGVSEKDQISFGNLIRFGSPLPGSWSFAKPGIPPKVPLTHIELEPQDKEAWMESIQEEMQNRPLDEIPPGPKEEGESLLGSLGKLGLGGLISATDALRDLFQGDEEEGNTSSEPGVLDRFSQWAKGKMDDLQARRNQQLNRLLNMFERNIDEALKYAIPLDSPYLNRGTASPSDRLGRRNPNFNLGGLGGGGRVDYWNVGGYYASLRKKYQLAAQAAIENGDFRKAAYIYAHLLGDFRAAANVLKQGKYFREAATLYQEHLNDKLSAVSCLEEGGLLLEAIEIYVELGKNEKAGDLYRELGQQEHAAQQYRIAYQEKIAQHKIIEASELLINKLHDTEAAKDLLLNGWEGRYQPDVCLRKYVSLVAQDDPTDLATHIKQIYRNKTPQNRKELFVKTLVNLNKKYQDTELLLASREIGYEVISEQIETGKVDLLHTLRSFLPEDRLIGSDTSRYKHLLRQLPPTPTPSHKEFQAYLFQTLTYPQISRWTEAMACGETYFVVGFKTGNAIVVRANQDGHQEYHTWPISGPIGFSKLLSEYPTSNQLFLLATETILTETHNFLPSEQYSKAFDLSSLPWLPKYPLGVSIDSSSRISVLTQPGNALMLSQYSMDGKLIRSFDLQLERLSVPISIPGRPMGTQMLYQRNWYYFISGEFLIRFNEDGKIEYEELDFPATHLHASPFHSAFRIVVHTTEWCYLYYPNSYGVNQVARWKSLQNISDLQFLPNNKLAISGEEEVQVYQIFRDRNPVLLGTCAIPTQYGIVSLFPTEKREECAVLTSEGKVYRFVV